MIKQKRTTGPVAEGPSLNFFSGDYFFKKSPEKKVAPGSLGTTFGNYEGFG